MGQQFPTYNEDLQQLSDCLGEGIKQRWSHELRKQILLLLHQLKTVSRKLANSDLESELMALEVTMGYGSGVNIEPDSVMIEEHQIRLLELAGLADDSKQEVVIEEQEVAIEEQDSQIVDEEIVEPQLDRIQLILCNCPGRDAARELAHGVIKTRLAACVNIIANIGSIYWWQGEIKDTAECQLQIKTADACVEDLIHYINQNHPNEVPEILVFPVDKGNEDYFEWVKQETSEKQDV